MNQDPNNISNKQNPVGRFMVAAGAVIELNHTGKILLVKRSESLDWQPSQWEITYGRIDQFEDIEAGLKREVFEELGLKDITVGAILSVWHIFRGSKKAENELIGVTYHCSTNTETISLSKEHSHYQWILPEEAVALVHISGIRRDIYKFIDYYGNART